MSSLHLAKFKKKSVDELSIWLSENGVQDEYCQFFEGEVNL